MRCWTRRPEREAAKAAKELAAARAEIIRQDAHRAADTTPEFAAWVRITIGPIVHLARGYDPPGSTRCGTSVSPGLSTITWPWQPLLGEAEICPACARIERSTA